MQPVGREAVEAQLHLLLDELTSPRSMGLGPRVSGSDEAPHKVGGLGGAPQQRAPAKHVPISGISRNFLHKVRWRISIPRPQGSSTALARLRVRRYLHYPGELARPRS